MELRQAYERHVLSRVLERAMRDTIDLRRELLAGLGGRVLEVGVGTGVNLPLYPASVGELVAVDPAAGLLEHARRAAPRAPCRVELVEASASRPLPFEAASFDAVVITFVLCSVSRVDAMLGEARRLLKPGAPLVLAEHVRAPGAMLAGAQRAIKPLWSTLLGGCDPGFDALGALDRAGFDGRSLAPVRLPFPFPVTTGLTGAVRLR